ncbi:fatty acid CoA ligase family protein [Streptomyces sp. NPDC026672]|uniref:fatty acid CoA ligase family protein n=1 Tax=unclassified Streptomyces TaxID=2593676 RepID=UPI0033F9A15E
MSPTAVSVGLGEGPADILERYARAFPAKAAIIHPDGHRAGGAIRYGELTYGELQDRVERLAAGFHRAGITRGTRTILMTPPGPDLFAIAFALFRIGAIPVVVDPGMGVKRMLHCYRTVGAEAFIGPPVAHVVRVLGRRTFRGVRTRITLGRRWFWGGETLERLGDGPRAEDLPRPSGDDLLMIAFTTGSTGPAKGVKYTQRMTAPMVRQMLALHDRDRDAVSLVTLPVYGILDLLCGSTLVLAPLSPAKVANARPELLTEALTRFEVTSMIASPALLRVLGRYLTQRRTTLPELRFVASGGAPVPPDVVETVRGVLSEKAELHVTYGATEALPVSSIESAEVLLETAALSASGAGTCVGRPLEGMAARIIQVSDAPLARWDPELAVPEGEIGEIVLAGESVSPGYYADPVADAQHKIREETGDGTTRLWHRTGDLGYLDASGRLWFCGRRTQRVRTPGGDLYTVQCEGVFNAHPAVRRTALVGVGEPAAQRPVVCVETEPGAGDVEWRQLVSELRHLAAGQPVTQGLGEFLRHPAFPVDIRHNAKIGREQLARWATRRLASSAAATRRVRALRAIPLLGWVYVAAGPALPTDQPVLRALWWVDVFLSVVVHAAQIPKALPRGRAAGYSGAATAGLTMLYGATWWRTLPPATGPVRHENPGAS